MCVFCVNDIAFICVSALLRRTITSHLKGQSASYTPRTYACFVFRYLHPSVCISISLSPPHVICTSTYLSVIRLRVSSAYLFVLLVVFCSSSPCLFLKINYLLQKWGKRDIFLSVPFLPSPLFDQIHRVSAQLHRL